MPLAAQTRQGWAELDFVGVWRGVTFTVPTIARLDTERPNPQLLASGLTADVRVTQLLGATAGVLVVSLPQGSGPLVLVPLVALSPSVALGPLRVATRLRLEQLRGLGDSPVRFRARLLVDLPLREGRWHLFASDEAIRDLTAGAWTQNRLQIGGGARLSPRVGVDVYWLHRTVPGAPTATEVLGVTARVRVF